MISKKFALALSLTAAFGLIACDDSSSSPNSDTPTDPSQVKIDCEVSTSGNAVTVKYGVASVGEMVTTTFELNGDEIIETFVEDFTTSNLNAAIVDEACEDAKKENKDAEITCSGKTITVVTTEDAEGQSLDDLKKMADGMCEAMKGNVDIEDPDEPDEPSSGDDPDAETSSSSEASGEDPAAESSSSSEASGEDPAAESSSSFADMTKCNEEGATMEVGSGDFTTTLVCQDGEWTADTTAFMEMMQCNEEGATQELELMPGMSVKMVCVDGNWTPDSSAAEDMTKCDTEGATKEMEVAGITMNLVCTDGEWVADEQAIEDQFTCTAAEEGQKKEMDMGNGAVLPLVCTNGQWAPDMSGGIQDSTFLEK